MSSAADFLTGYFQLMNLNGASHVYREAGRAGIFRELLTGRKTAAQLAAACEIGERPTRLLLEALAALGVVTTGEDHSFRLSPLGQMLLSGSYRNLGDEYWAHLPKFLASGEPIIKVEEQSEAYYQSQAAVLGWMLTPAAECAARLLCDKLPPAATILDVGAGSAVWSLQLAAATDDAAVTVNDWPAVLEVATETAEQLGLADRLTTIAGNYHEAEFLSKTFDLIILANITHLETPAGNQRLLTKARAALKPGGLVAIIDVFPGQPAGDLNRTLYTLGLALRTEQGQVYSPDELQAQLLEAGFRNPQLLPLEVPPYVLGILLGSV